MSGCLLYRYYLKHRFFEFFFLLTYAMFIYWPFSSLCICLPYSSRHNDYAHSFDSYLHCVKSVQIRTRKYSVFGHFSCSVSFYFKFVDWKVATSCFLFLFNELMEEGKKRENSNEFFTHGLGETIRVFNEVLSKMSCAIKLKFSFAII